MAREILEYRKKEATALDEAAKVVENFNYMLDIGSPEEGPFTKQDRVCKETREQAAAAIRALKATKLEKEKESE